MKTKKRKPTPEQVIIALAATDKFSYKFMIQLTGNLRQAYAIYYDLGLDGSKP